MGTWGPGTFENDAALDCMAEIVDGRGVSAIDQYLDRVLGVGRDYLEAPDAECTIAMAEMVASLAGRRGEGTDVPPEITEWLMTTTEAPTPALVAKARLAVQRAVTEPSELLELWQGSPDFPMWKASVDDLLGRL